MTNAKPAFHDASRFWQKLGGEHALELEAHGFEDVKRRQALRYFTWQWRAKRATQSEQLSYLMRQTRMSTLVRSAAISPRALRHGDWTPLPWSRADRWLYTFATRLLWEQAMAYSNDARRVLGLGEPLLGNPPPVHWRGQLISQDLANSAFEISAFMRTLGGREPESIVEIGAGYGRTAYAMLGMFPNARYTIVDIEPALSIARWYLGTLFPSRSIEFVPASEAHALHDSAFDAAVSISSLHEMRPDQVAGYLSLIDRVMRDGGTVYLKQWREWRNPDDGVTLTFSQYPIPARWQPIFFETCPVQTRFEQAGWRRSDAA